VLWKQKEQLTYLLGNPRRDLRRCGGLFLLPTGASQVNRGGGREQYRKEFQAEGKFVQM